jgi:hypothetical protein
MLRRLFMLAIPLLVSWRPARGQVRLPRGDLPARQVLDFGSLIAQTLHIATKVEPDAEKLLRETISQGFSQLEVPAVPLANLPLGRVPDLIVAQRNVSGFLLAVLQAGKNAEGQIILTKDSVAGALNKLCPLFPFC